MCLNVAFGLVRVYQELCDRLGTPYRTVAEQPRHLDQGRQEVF